MASPVRLILGSMANVPAAELGADAVVITQAQGLMFGSLQGVNAAGKAIRWTEEKVVPTPTPGTMFAPLPDNY
jgi:hypothetical protein